MCRGEGTVAALSNTVLASGSALCARFHSFWRSHPVSAGSGGDGLVWDDALMIW